MKHLYLMFLVVFFTAKITQAQSTPSTATGYFFKHTSNVALENMAGATLLLGPTRADDQASEVTPISFPFEFAGRNFSAIQAFSSGALIVTNPGTTIQSPYQILLPWADAIGTGDNGHISYKVVGTANRKFVIEYYMSNYVSSTSFAAIADKKFQIWLFENSNQIQFVYGDGTTKAAQAVVGIAGDDNGDLLQVETLNHEITADANYLSVNWPGFGKSYIFSPVAFSTVNPTAVITAAHATSVCSGETVALSAVLNDADATGYQWMLNGLPVDGATDQTFNAAQSGSYSVQVQYASGNATSSMINVFVTTLNATVQSSNITCNAVNNGTITIKNASGANDIYEYSIGNGIWKSGEVFSNLAAGTYNVQMRSGNCVKSLGSVQIKDESAPPAVSILVGKGGACANVALTANPSGAANYKWSNGATGQTLVLDNNDADGLYTVTVSNGNGCSGAGSYLYNKEDQLNSYSIIGSKGISIGQNNIVNGAIGNKGTIPVYVDKNSTVNSFIRSSAVTLNATNVTVTGKITYSDTRVIMPTVYSNTSVLTGLTNFSVADNFTGTINGNYNTLVIGKRAKVVITGTIFGKVEVKEGAEVSFSSKDISIDDLVTDDGNKSLTTGSLTTLNFVEQSIIRVKNKVEIGKRNRVNAAGSTFYLDDVRQDAEKMKVDGSNTIVNGNVIITKGKLTISNADASNPCIMNGAYFCEYIVSGDYVTWNRNTCNVFAPRVSNVANTLVISGDVKLNAYPNPSNGNFVITIKNTKATKAEVVVMNVSGSVVKSQTFTNIYAGKVLNINMSNQPAGMYTVKVITTEGEKSMKMMIRK